MIEYQIGCDIGGTFTDVAAVASDGSVFIDKAFTTPDNLTYGLVDALENLAKRVEVPLTELLGATSRFVNGTTVVTNSIAELRGARVGLITTEGFGDNLLVARSARNAHRDPHQQLNLPQIVPRNRVVEVTERVDRKGTAVVALTEANARHAVKTLVGEGVEAIAVSLLWSFLNPEHEELIARIVEEEHPDIFLSVSARLHPVIREYERTMTTVLNAFTGQRVAEYIGRVESELSQRGLRVPVVFMQGFGGTLSAEEARKRPITLIDSGPAGGVIGARALARRLGVTDLVTADMGGTSFDVSVLQGAEPLVTQRVMLREQFLTALSKIDVFPIGAGGGSIAWLDSRGVPQVGPRSAGAEPGPICYGKGGTAPTVTDAVAVLGLLDPAAFLGGRRELTVSQAEEALARELGKPLGLDAVQSAAAVYRMVTANMSNAVRSVTVERGHDPRTFSLFAFGGAVGIFAADIARSLGIRRIVLPSDAAVFSAHGLLASDDVRTHARSAMWSGGDATDVAASLRELDAQLTQSLRDAGYSDDQIDVQWQGDLKFAGQQWELKVPIPRKDELTEADLVKVQEAFPERYEAEYGKGTAWVGNPVVLMSVRVIATGHAKSYEPAPAVVRKASAQSSGRRSVYLPLAGEQVELDVYHADQLAPGARLVGPAMVEHPLTTIQVPQGWQLEMDQWGNCVLTDINVDKEVVQ
ncbi:hydantoinase/oxoprolinase family protein [Rhodococcus sp. NPDC059968]|uniref:hydantoinase/oxoprolinase family protein n=1 Tax=Rhodococcus sp. NPDC059968 TaxID=3347017 RepID=UPI00366CC7DA